MKERRQVDTFGAVAERTFFYSSNILRASILLLLNVSNQRIDRIVGN